MKPLHKYIYEGILDIDDETDTDSMSNNLLKEALAADIALISSTIYPEDLDDILPSYSLRKRELVLTKIKNNESIFSRDRFFIGPNILNLLKGLGIKKITANKRGREVIIFSAEDELDFNGISCDFKGNIVELLGKNPACKIQNLKGSIGRMKIGRDVVFDKCDIEFYDDYSCIQCYGVTMSANCPLKFIDNRVKEAVKFDFMYNPMPSVDQLLKTMANEGYFVYDGQHGIRPPEEKILQPNPEKLFGFLKYNKNTTITIFIPDAIIKQYFGGTVIYYIHNIAGKDASKLMTSPTHVYKKFKNSDYMAEFAIR